jgi:dolichyldiphosphatase
VLTRELVIIDMWAGQFLCEALNWALKRLIKQDRPDGVLFIATYCFDRVVHIRILDSLSGYGFPSSHSQYMGYFASFLLCHLYFRHRFASSGLPIFDKLLRLSVYLGVTAWAGAVAYSRFAVLNITPSSYSNKIIDYT